MICPNCDEENNTNKACLSCKTKKNISENGLIKKNVVILSPIFKKQVLVIIGIIVIISTIISLAKTKSPTQNATADIVSIQSSASSQPISSSSSSQSESIRSESSQSNEIKIDESINNVKVLDQS